MVRTVVIQETGEVVLPRKTLEASPITAGIELVVVAGADSAARPKADTSSNKGDRATDAGRIAFLLGAFGQGGCLHWPQSGRYLALSEEEDTALWDRLVKETEQELKIREQNIPADFVPARQKHS